MAPFLCMGRQVSQMIFRMWQKLYNDGIPHSESQCGIIPKTFSQIVTVTGAVELAELSSLLVVVTGQAGM